MDVAYALAGNAVTRRYTDLSDETIQVTMASLIDSLACALAGTNAPGMAQARGAMTRWGQGEGCTLWGGFGRAPAPIAAFLNGGSLHALDYDDTDDKVPLHANSVVLPALLADLEENFPDCDGQRFITALAVGLDGAMRVGRSGGPKGSRGWNYSVISGCMGAILAIANLRQWDTDKAVSALGQTSGSLQSIIDGSLAKRFQPALLAKNVLVSVALAEAGIDGARNVFEGKAGFFHLYQDGKFDRGALLAEIESCALVADLRLKPYPSCSFTHAPIDLALGLQQQGVTPADIGKLDIRVSGQAVNMVGRAYDHATAGVVDAQFSIAYTCAVALHKGAVKTGDFTLDAIADPVIGRFAAEKISIHADDSIPFLGMAPVHFDVELLNGKRLQCSTDVVAGSPQKPLQPDQLRSKVLDCLAFNDSKVDGDQLISVAQDLQNGAQIRDLIALLA